MVFINFLVDSVLSEPAVVIGLVALVGLIALRKSISEVLTGTIKTIVGFLILGAGAGVLVNALMPLGPLLQSIVGVPGVIPTNELVIGFAIAEYGTQGAMIMALAFAVNILVARFTRFKFLFLSGHIVFFTSYLVAVILASYLPVSSNLTILIGGILVGLYMAIAPAIVHKYTLKVTGGEEIALGHSSTVSALTAGVVGSLIGNPKNKMDDLKVPKGLGFIRDMLVMMAASMFVIFLAAVLLAGSDAVSAAVGDQNWFMWVVMSSLMFAGGVAVMLMGVRMTIAEIVPAFKGISTKIVPDAVPALDCPVVFPFSPNSVVPGFLMSMLGGFAAMGLLYSLNYAYVIIPGVIPHFFTGATAAVYGNAMGGKRGALIGGFLNGFLFMGIGIALLLPATGDLVATGTTFPDPDMGGIWMVVAYIVKLIGGFIG